MNKRNPPPPPLPKRASVRAVGADPEFLDQLMVLYLKDAARGIVRIRSLVRSGRFKEIEKESHRLKGASLSLSLHFLVKAFEDLEEAAEERNTRSIALVLKWLATELNALRRFWTATAKP